MDQRVVLSHDGRIYGLQLKPFTIQHPDSALEGFTNHFFGKHETVGFYNGNLLYHSIEQKSHQNIYGEGMMAVTSYQFRM